MVTKAPCDPDSTSCEVDCFFRGDVTECGPISYLWRRDEGELTVSESGAQLIITKDEDRGVKTFTCEVRNAFSEERSDLLPNLLYQEGTA